MGGSAGIFEQIWYKKICFIKVQKEWKNVILIHLYQELVNFPVKGPLVHILDFAGHTISAQLLNSVVVQKQP